ncbi:hypothetical protein [Shewanella cyperi]|uniref:hypothetical protein n=1 Tax=Shewanella cyperi TaxID=2814292 RepID=UPI001A942A8F|nr:hypothetical protein [Shewanella cyperi]QSX40335.1 hypothetical protein JYB84_15430 [Shewanella cyperi]
MRKFAFLLGLVLVGCQSTPQAPSAPSYQGELIDVGYFDKYGYWQPQRTQSRLDIGAEKVRKQLAAKGVVVAIYEYKIDSTGQLWELNLIQSVPEGAVTAEDLIKAKLVDAHWNVAINNKELTPVKVTERMVIMQSGVAIPPDDMNINDFLKQLNSKDQR